MAERSQTPAPVVIGMVLQERWRLEASLGTGGMAEVFRATDLQTGARVAVKVLRASLETSPEAIQRFRREGDLLVRLKNPAIVAASTIGALADGRLYIVMELLEGETLGARLKRGPMTTAELAPIVAGCAVGLAAAHAAGVVHRDLKPENVLLVPRSDGSVQVKLVDFGVSKVFNGEKLTQTGQVLGTPRYMSPEQLGAEPEVDHRVDLYALGIILYEALSGRSPFLASTPTDLIVAILHGKTVPLRSVRSDVPAALEAVVMRAMARVRDARYRAATELADAFFEAAGIDARARPAQRHGMATTPLGAMRAADGGASFDDVSTGGVEDAAASALKLGTFSSFEAIDMKEVLAANSTAPAPLGIGSEAATAAAKRAAAATGLAPSSVARDAPARDAAAGMPSRNAADAGRSPRAGVPPRDALAGEPPAPARPRREIPATSLSPMVRGIEPTPQMLPTPAVRRDPSGAARRDPSGTAPHQGGGPAYPGRISRSSSASIAGANAPRAVAMDGARPSQGLLLVGIGLLAGALTAGVVVAVLTWTTQMSGENRSRPPPPPPRPGADATAGPDGGAADSASSGTTAAAEGSSAPSGTTGTTSPAAASSGGGASGAGASGASASGAGSSGASATGATAATGSSSRGGSSGGTAASGSSGGTRSGSSSSSGSSGARSSSGGSSGSSGGSGSSGASGASGSSGGSGSSSSGGGGSGGGTLAEATRALARGDYTECVDILDDVIARGATPTAVRRRAECLMRLGEVGKATRDYRRFCRIAPGDSEIPAVREILAGVGVTCP